MTTQEVIQEIKHFSIDEKVLLIEQISQSLQNDLKAKDQALQIQNEKRGLTTAERVAIVESLYGIARIEGQPAPTDEEIREDRVNYLLEKYS